MLSMLYNVINGKLPKVLRVCTTGSRSCEQLFLLLRSMTPFFSTIINFTLKGVLERIHKLNYISSTECKEEIVYPRVQRKLLQLNDEADETFSVPSLGEVETHIKESKGRAVVLSKQCGMELISYDDNYFVKDTIHLIEVAIQHDHENKDVTNIQGDTEESELEVMAASDIACIKEDIVVIRLKRKGDASLPTYIPSSEKGYARNHSYSTVVDSRKSRKTQFFEYNLQKNL